MSKIKILMLLVVVIAKSITAQTKNETALFKTFVSVCNAYKQLPLQLKLDYKKTTNFLSTAEDTATSEAFFSVQKEGMYMKFGDTEQLLNDSLVLMVLHSIKQMVVMQNTQELTMQFNKAINPGLPDSLLDKLSEQYTIQQQGDGSTSIIKLWSKQTVINSSVPKQEIELTYNSKNLMPIKIETIARRLVATNADAQLNDAIKTVDIEGRGKFIVKEDNTQYLYKSITHNNEKLPYVVFDKVKINEEGSYIPVKEYETYNITQQ